MNIIDNEAAAAIPAVLTTHEVCDVLKISTRTFYRLVESGRLAAFRIGGAYRVNRAALIAFMSAKPFRKRKSQVTPSAGDR